MRRSPPSAASVKQPEDHAKVWIWPQLDLDAEVETAGDVARDAEDDRDWPGGVTCYACANETRRAHRSPEGLLCTTCWRFWQRTFSDAPCDADQNGPVSEGFDGKTARMYAMNGPSEAEDFRQKRRSAVAGW